MLQQLPVIAPAPLRRHRRLRAKVLIGVHLAIAVHLAIFTLRGRALSPVEPSEAMYTLELGFVNAGAIFLMTALVATVIYGRFLCGWGCHLIALQDWSGYLLARLGLRVRPLRSRLLALVSYFLAAYMFLWPTADRLWLGRPHPGFSNHLVTTSFWATFPNLLFATLTFLVCGGLIVYLLGNKGFCTYACPYGALFGIADRMAWGRIRVTEGCTGCGQCTAHCTSNVLIHAEVKNYGMVVDHGCMKCLDCVDVCPTGALFYGLQSRRAASDSQVLRARPKKTYDFTLPEEFVAILVAAFTTFALRGLYDGPPLLLSTACGAITGALAINWKRALQTTKPGRDASRFARRPALRRAASIAFTLWCAVLVHSGFVQYHRYTGLAQLSRASLAWEQLLSNADPPDDTVRPLVAAAHRHLSFAQRWGLSTTADVELAMAYTSMFHGQHDLAESHLRAAFELQDRSEAIGEMLAELLASQGRQSEVAELLASYGR